MGKIGEKEIRNLSKEREMTGGSMMVMRVTPPALASLLCSACFSGFQFEKALFFYKWKFDGFIWLAFLIPI